MTITLRGPVRDHRGPCPVEQSSGGIGGFLQLGYKERHVSVIGVPRELLTFLSVATKNRVLNLVPGNGAINACWNLLTCHLF